MGMYSHLKETFQQEYAERTPAYKARLTKWRSEPVVVRAERPTNIARARELGYKAKQGIVIARIRIKRGMRHRQKPTKGRKAGKRARYLSPGRSLQTQAEERAATHFPNTEALNSYFVGSDGMYKFFEVILIERGHPVIRASPELIAAAMQRGRARRGLTSSGKKGRGLLHKGRGTEKVRPSIRARHKQGK